MPSYKWPPKLLFLLRKFIIALTLSLFVLATLANVAMHSTMLQPRGLGRNKEKLQRQIHLDLVWLENNLNASSVPTAKLLESSNSGNLLCRYSTTGCCTESSMLLLEKPIKTLNVTFFWECINGCTQNQFVYAAFSKNSNCVCGDAISKKLVLESESFLTRTSCHKNETVIYKLQGQCSLIDLNDIEKSTVACLPIQGKSVLPDINFQTFSTNCAIFCEQNKFMFALINFALPKCICAGTDLNRFVNSLPGKEHCDPGTEMQVVRRNVQDERCSVKRFEPNQTTLTGLVSFPGSGNTWTRHLLEQASGLYTGSIYYDEELYEQGFLGELLPWDSRKCAVIKSHKPTLEFTSKFDKVILLIRNPFDAILSEYNRLQGGHTGFANLSHFESDKWSKFVPYKIKKWTRTIDEHLLSEKDLMIIYYENLVNNPIAELKKMIEFTGLRIPNLNERLLCTKRNLQGGFRREKKSFNPYLPWMVNLINLHIVEVTGILEEFGPKDFPGYLRNLV